MNCPNCAQSMTVYTLGGRLDTRIEIDACDACQAFWFDSSESPRLSPASTLTLFSFIADALPRRRGSIGRVLKCPRCGSRLLETSDMQRNTRFSYSRCPHGHGRFTTFFNFLREKDFVRPLSAAQVEELRRNVQTVNCSNCGAPVDLTRGSSCGHCASPLSILDLQQAEQVVDQLRRASQPQAVDPALPLELARVRREIDAAFAGSGDPTISWWGDTSSIGLVGAGISALARLLKKAR
jgi:Zn-finger nucleic acid-binding protein